MTKTELKSLAKRAAIIRDLITSLHEDLVEAKENAEE
jgi:hypothetical protein